MTPLAVLMALTRQPARLSERSTASLSLAARATGDTLTSTFPSRQVDNKVPFSDEMQLQQSFKEVVSFVPVFLVASILRKGGGGAVDRESNRERRNNKKNKTSERTTV